MPLLVMNIEQKAKWSETRVKGRGSFILFHGVFRIGVPFAVLTTLSDYFLKYGLTSSKAADYLLSGETILRFFFGVLFFGSSMGLLTWYSKEREFEKPEKNNL